MTGAFSTVPAPPALPAPVRLLADALAGLAGATAVVLGGSRGTNAADAESDWDLVVYYRESIDLEPLRAYGEIHPPGSWGRIMNGGGWLSVQNTEVDVLLRDLDVAMHWTRAAEAGVFEVDALLGYLAGVPTYLLAGELASGAVLSGEQPVVGAVPPRLAAAGPPRWRFARDFSLEYAQMHAKRGDAVGAAAQVAKAAMEEAHARACEQRWWVLNEKRLLARAGLGEVATHFARIPDTGEELTRWVDRLTRIVAT